LNISIIFFYILTIATNANPTINNQSDLFQSVFGNKSKEQIISVPVYYKKNSVGELHSKLSVDGRKVKTINKGQLYKILEGLLNEKAIKKLDTIPKIKFISLNVLSKEEIEITFNSELFRLDIIIAPELEKEKISIFSSNTPDWVKTPLLPQKYSGYLNYYLEQDISKNLNQSGVFSADFDFVLNLSSYVFESEFFYDSESNWYRGDLRIVKDSTSRLTRFTFGDLSQSVIGYQNSLDMAGISYRKENSIDPYKTLTPNNRQDFVLQNRSTVHIYVNSTLIRSLILNAGKHSLQDLPLTDGLNDIVIVAIDDKGKKTIYNFTNPASNELLRKSETEFNYSTGFTYETLTNDRKYDQEKLGPLLSLYQSYGFTNYYTGGFGFQASKNQAMLSINNVLSTKLGQFSNELAFSNEFGKKKGFAQKLNYFLKFNQQKESSQKSFNFGLEFINPYFSSIGDKDRYNNLSYIYSTNYSQELTKTISLNLGLTYSETRNVDQYDLYNYSISISQYLLDEMQLSLYYSKERDIDKKWSDNLYCSLNFSIPEKNISNLSSYNSEGRRKRIDVSKHSSKPVGGVSTNLGIEDNDVEKSLESEFSYNNHRFRTKLSHDIINRDDKTNYSSNTKLNFSSSFLFTKNTFSSAQPVEGSFAIIKPNKHIIGRTIPVNKHKDYSETEINNWGPGVITSMQPYQYYRLHLDPSYLEEGESLGKENYTLYPTYKSGHILNVGKASSVLLVAKLINENGKYLSLETGYISALKDDTKIPFFTNKKGRIVIEGLSPGKYLINFDTKFLSSKYIIIPKNTKGILKFGNILIEKIKGLD
jgi:outer membrane usher protein